MLKLGTHHLRSYCPKGSSLFPILTAQSVITCNPPPKFTQGMLFHSSPSHLPAIIINIVASKAMTDPHQTQPWDPTLALSGVPRPCPCQPHRSNHDGDWLIRSRACECVTAAPNPIRSLDQGTCRPGCPFGNKEGSLPLWGCAGWLRLHPKLE
jgi:hypothetical protein